MLHSETLQFESPRAVETLHASDARLIPLVEEEMGVKITIRDGWLKIEGDDALRVARTRKMFEQLDRARQKGLRIGRHEFNYALKAASRGEDANFDELGEIRIVCSLRKPAIVAKTRGQREYIQGIRSHDIVFGVGPAGTGKTYLAMAMALNALKTEQVRRIVLTRPAVEAGEALGFLPGDLQQKIYPYLRPLYDALYDMMEETEIQKYLERGVIEVAPLAYMRGRTLNGAFVILDEAQNTTREQMFMFLTRLGAESRCVITGDKTQVDLPGNVQSGLAEAINALRGVRGIHFSFLDQQDVVRHPLVQSIITAYQRHRGQEPAPAAPADPPPAPAHS